MSIHYVILYTYSTVALFRYTHIYLHHNNYYDLDTHIYNICKSLGEVGRHLLYSHQETFAIEKSKFSSREVPFAIALGNVQKWCNKSWKRCGNYIYILYILYYIYIYYIRYINSILDI